MCARIAFFTERLPPDDKDPISVFSYELMRSLAEQQHEIRVFSTYREGAALPPAPSRLEILRPFRRWNWFELPRVVPILMHFRPDILHVIQPRAEALEGFTNAMSALPGLVPLPLSSRPSIVTSMYDLRPESLKAQRALLLASDAVTASNQPQLEMIKAYVEKFRHRPAMTVLPIPGTSDGPSDHPSNALLSFMEQHPKTIFIPGDISELRSVADVFDALAELTHRIPGSAVVFGGGWGTLGPLKRHELMARFENRGVGSRVFISGPLAEPEERACLTRAFVVFTASLPGESLRLTQVLRNALAASALIIMSRRQAQLDSLPWRDREQALLTEESALDWSSRLAEALSSAEIGPMIRRRLPDFARTEALDQPGNIMSRLYTRVLNTTSTF